MTLILKPDPFMETHNMQSKCISCKKIANIGIHLLLLLLGENRFFFHKRKFHYFMYTIIKILNKECVCAQAYEMYNISSWLQTVEIRENSWRPRFPTFPHSPLWILKPRRSAENQLLTRFCCCCLYIHFVFQTRS